MNELITIVGPTAVGKTDLTLALAKSYNSPVISGDAYQVYKGFSIGTAKPSEKELQEVKHYLIDIINAHEPYSVADFKEKAEYIIALENKRNHVPILSGGTGLYVQSLLEDYHFTDTAPDKKLREELEKLHEEKGVAGLLEEATRLAQIHHIELAFTDKHRLFRAIELMRKNDVEALINQTKEGLSYKGPIIGLMRDREELYEIINLRVDLMVEAGLFDEVEHLLAEGYDRDCQAFKAIGYKEAVAFFNGECTKAEAIDRIKQNTRRFAKRQITWYKRMPYIHWFNLSRDYNSETLREATMELIEKTTSLTKEG